MSRILQALSRVSQDVDEPLVPDEIRPEPLPELSEPPARPAFAARPLPSPAAPVDSDVETVIPARQLPSQPAVTDGGIETNEKLVVSKLMTPVALEAYRKLAAQLHRSTADRKTTVIMVVSATAGEGKTLTSVNLALTLSESFRRRVLLIDADLRRPTVHEAFQLPNLAGLSDGLTATSDSKLAVVNVSPSLTILPAGRATADPVRMLTSERMRDIIESASANFDWVIIDTPPIGFLTDANLLAEMADMVLLVVGAGAASYQVIAKAVKGMDRSRIAGVVLNRVAESRRDHKYYDRYYGNADAR